METQKIQDYDFTSAAWESLYEAIEDSQFFDKDAQLIYNTLRHNMKIRSFGDYLRRYIFKKAELPEPYSEIPLKEYQLIIRSSFLDNYTPTSFTGTAAKLSALSKNWLTQQTVKRNVVFLLGFGLNMSVDDVNMFLTKALREPEINAKNPFEVICWYCYHKRFNYLKFEQLWERYSKLKPAPLAKECFDGEQTCNIRHSMQSSQDDAALMKHLAKLKATEKMSAMSFTARQHFDRLYDEARELIAGIYNVHEDDKMEAAVQKLIHRLSFNTRLFDFEKRNQIEQLRSQKRVFHKDDITGSDIEQIICSAIPTDRHGNLTLSKASRLNEQFAGKRFSRQHIHDILEGKVEVNRFDLITLNFFVFSQKLKEYPDAKTRYIRFCESTGDILKACFLGDIYVQNPYECFILMCILSNDPLGTYAEVWELSYRQSEE